MAQGELSNPTYEEEQSLHDLLNKSAEAHAILLEAGLHREAEQVRLQALTEISNRAYTIVRTLGLQAVTEGRLSRVGLANIMGVHQGTVARWVKSAQTEPDRDYANTPRSRVQRDPKHKDD